MKTRRLITYYYDTEEERDREKIKAIDNGLSILCEIKEGGEYGFTYEIIYK